MRLYITLRELVNVAYQVPYGFRTVKHGLTREDDLCWDTGVKGWRPITITSMPYHVESYIAVIRKIKPPKGYELVTMDAPADLYWENGKWHPWNETMGREYQAAARRKQDD